MIFCGAVTLLCGAVSIASWRNGDAFGAVLAGGAFIIFGSFTWELYKLKKRMEQ